MGNFQERLRTLCQKEGKSYRMISELCGLSSNSIRRYVGGSVQPGLAAIISIADHFDVSIDFLVGRSDRK